MCLQSNPGLPRNVVQAGWAKIVIARLKVESSCRREHATSIGIARLLLRVLHKGEKAWVASHVAFLMLDLRIGKEENSDLQTILRFCHIDIATPIQNEACPCLHDPISGADSDDLAPIAVRRRELL